LSDVVSFGMCNNKLAECLVSLCVLLQRVGVISCFASTLYIVLGGSVCAWLFHLRYIRTPSAIPLVE